MSTSVIQTGPCQPWTTPDEIAACCGSDLDSTIDLDAAADIASSMLYELSGHEFPGICSATVRPCASNVSCWVPATQHLGSWGSYFYWGSRLNWATGDCSCRRLSKIRLAGYPVREITSVKIDGDVVPPTEYRLDRGRELVRLADAAGQPQFWPACQRLDLNEGVGTFIVEYDYGLAPPAGASGAAAQLACAIARACGNDDDCDLPAGTVRVSRQGISIDTQALGLWLIGSIRTGMPMVDAFITIYGRPRRARRAALSVPEADPWPLRV